MSTPARRRLVLVISSLSLGLTLGCSASETTNTVAYTAGGTVATGGQNGTSGGGAANAGGKGGGARPPVEHQLSYVTLLLALQGQRAGCVLYVASALALELLARLRG